jgi:hypothetical protein
VTGDQQPAVRADLGGGHGDEQSPPMAAALDWAEVAAMLGDYREALAWLEYVERASGALPAEYAEHRRAWLAQVSDAA